MAQILIIEDEPGLGTSLCESLRLSGHDAHVARSGEEGLDSADANAPDVILLDLHLPGIDGLEVLRTLTHRGSGASVIVMTAYGNVESAVEAMKAGAADYLTKPLDLSELDVVIDRVLEHRRVAASLDYFRKREGRASALEQVIGESEPMMAVTRFVQRIVSTNALASDLPPSILLTGETGTGKDLIARAIHYAGPRRDGPFVHVNCTALPDTLAEAELFGYVKGAFTDARVDKRGLFDVADGGTVFLDEVGSMRMPLQAKLLGTFERQTIRPVGGTSERRINVHVIAATNRNLPEAIRAGEFREDLFHRLRVLTLALPPLRERGDDVALLASHFARVYAERFGMAIQGFTPEALSRIRSYDWPGNVRELSHAVESAVLIADGPRIRPEHLNIQAAEPGGGVHVELPGDVTITMDFSGAGPKLEDIEHRIIQAALEHAKHNASRAARILGISRDAIRYRLEKHRKEARPDEGD